MQNNSIETLIESFGGMTGKPIPAREREVWESICEHKMLPARKRILLQDAQPTECYFIIKGVCRQYYLDDSGAEITRGFVSEGGFCCAEAFFEAERSRCTIETLETCHVVAFKPREAEKLLRDSMYMHSVYENALIHNIRRRIARENMLITCSAIERYQQFFKMYPELEGRIKQVHLATYLGINQVTLSRVRRAIRENEEAEA